MAGSTRIYLFRSTTFARNGDTVVCAAPLCIVISVYGGGGLFGEGGVRAVFGGCAFFRDDKTGPAYVGIWGSRKASRFRETLRQAGLRLTIVQTPPPARLMFWGAKSGRRLRPAKLFRAPPARRA
jgi:hypothetical protein